MPHRVRNGEPRGAVEALVLSDGDVEELTGPSGVHLLHGHPELVTWSVSFHQTGSRLLNFWWRPEGNGWYRVSFTTAESVGITGAGTAVRAEPAALPLGLTSRELDVITLIAAGLSNAEIAEALVVSRRTITTHVEHVLTKLGQPNRAAAAAQAVQEGIIRLPVPARQIPMGSLLAARVSGVGRPNEPSVSRPTGRAQGVVRRPLLIGSAFPLSGHAGPDGWEMANGAALAIAEINARGGIAGRTMDHVLVDVDIFNAEGVQGAMRALIDAEVDAITMGYVFPEDVALRRAADYGAPFLHGMTSETQVQHVRDDRGRLHNVFEVCPTEIHYGMEFIRYLTELERTGSWRPQNRRLLFVETAVPSGQMLTTETADLAQRNGWEIERLEMLPVGADAQATVRQIRSSDPAALMVTQFFAQELARLQQRFAATPSETLVYAVYAPSIPQFLEEAGAAAEGVLWATTTGTYSDQLGAAFAHRFASAYGTPPGRSHAGLAYDEVYILARAWACTPNPRRFPAVSETLRMMTHRGVNGAYAFDDQGQVGLAYPSVTLDASLGQAHLIFQVQDGRHRILSPVPYAEAEFRRPSWFSPRLEQQPA
jgi:branched-chain amino acid transport system substrate-binding protein